MVEASVGLDKLHATLIAMQDQMIIDKMTQIQTNLTGTTAGTARNAATTMSSFYSAVNANGVTTCRGYQTAAGVYPNALVDGSIATTSDGLGGIVITCSNITFASLA